MGGFSSSNMPSPKSFRCLISGNWMKPHWWWLADPTYSRTCLTKVVLWSWSLWNQFLIVRWIQTLRKWKEKLNHLQASIGFFSSSMFLHLGPPEKQWPWTMDCSCHICWCFLYFDIWGTKRHTMGSLFGAAFLACSQVLSSTLEGPAERHLLSPSENYAPGRKRIEDAKMVSCSLKSSLAMPYDVVWAADHPNLRRLFQQPTDFQNTDWFVFEIISDNHPQNSSELLFTCLFRACFS